MRARVLQVMVVTLLFVAAAATAASAAKKKGLRLLDHCPKDPLLVSVAEVDDLVRAFDEMLGIVRRLDDDDDGPDEGLAEFERSLGCSIRDDLLGPLGPEVGFVLDLPPIDMLVAGMADPAEGIPRALGGIGVLGQVAEADKLDACLRKLFTKQGKATLTDEDGLVRIVIGDGQEVPAFNLYYGFGGGHFALGADPDFVRASLSPRARGSRLSDGEDFARVAAQLDEAPESLVYVNVPKARELVRESAVIKTTIGSDPEAAALSDLLLSPEFLPMGIGSTSVEVDGGTRTTSFGPALLSGGRAKAGLLAAVAIPNLLNAIDRGKQKRTMADIRSSATAVEAYAVDNATYPGPTEDWVSADWLSDSLAPVYIRMLPVEDGWGRPILYWSNGESYLLVSPGRDGELERDWAAEPAEERTTSTFAADIVFGDGAFVQWPEGKQE